MISNLYQATVILCSTLYFNINQRVIEAVQTLCNFDDNENYWNRNVQRKSKICTKVSREIDQLCYLHRITTQAAQRITRILSVSLMLTTLFHFVVVITEVYYNYISLVSGLRAGHYDLYVQSLASLGFIIMCIVQFYHSISFSGHMTKRAEATAIFLNEFFLSDVDQCVERSIEIFTLEMLHHDYRLRMFDCFTMDGTLAYAAAATMTSYLVMLIQFGLVNH
ncbi:gustatory receptor for bitter taste 66a-like [Ochlerotatus camptorhynchus]|uniref:gustatory receptor for bitter taste 66a-like n=1 Tax=Ochlerotatus camptorhynchus TaxID=644619 RepID=UPI0031D24D15